MVEAMADKRIPRKKGQPANSKKHSDLYTDENPKGTIHGLKFATVEDAKASVAKIKKSGRKHAHQIQAAIAMEQRARVMGKTGPAAVYRKFINAMKKKTKAMQKESVQEKSKGLWYNIHKRRKSGKRMRKPGEKGAPTADALRSAQAASEATIRDNRPDHEIMRGSQGDARRKHDAVHGHGSYHKLPADQKMKLHRKEIDQRFADRGRKPPKYTIKHTGNKVGNVGSFEIHHTPLQKVRDRLRTPRETSEEMTTTANIPNPIDTAMGPRIKTVNVTDRRRKKDRIPVLLKRFRKYIDEVQ